MTVNDDPTHNTSCYNLATFFLVSSSLKRNYASLYLLCFHSLHLLVGNPAWKMFRKSAHPLPLLSLELKPWGKIQVATVAIPNLQGNSPWLCLMRTRISTKTNPLIKIPPPIPNGARPSKAKPNMAQILSTMKNLFPNKGPP